MTCPPRLLHVAILVSAVASAHLAADTAWRHQLAEARSPARQAADQQPPVTFRSRVTTVPIDVRVIDADGKPVTDLRQEDFAVFDDNVPQPIVHFSRQVLVAQAPGPAARARPGVPAFDGTPRNQRVFLIVLGSGSLGSRPLSGERGFGSQTATWVYASKVLEGLLHLVRDRLLPQDQVALLAYNRATDFTTDHEAVAGILERFRVSEPAGLAAFGGMSAATGVTRPMDSVFAAGRADIASTGSEDLGFAEYVQTAGSRLTSDAENLHYGIRYLRFMEGEKHLVYVTANGLFAPEPGTLQAMLARPWDYPDYLARAASDARVALHSIQTAGASEDPGEFLPALPIMKPLIVKPDQPQFGVPSSAGTRAEGRPVASTAQPGWDRPSPSPGASLPGLNARRFEALRGLRQMAAQTGGHVSIMTDVGKAADRIDVQTRAEYLVAYSPSNTNADGRFRQVRVEVARPGLTVLYRRGYYASEETTSLDRRRIIADRRLVAAVSSTRAFRDLAFSVAPAFTRAKKGKGGEVLVSLAIDASSLAWTTDDLSRRVAHLDLAIYCGAGNDKVVGQSRRIVDVALTEEQFGQVVKQGLPYGVRIPVTAAPRFLKVVVYNLESDRTGSAVVTMK